LARLAAGGGVKLYREAGLDDIGKDVTGKNHAQMGNKADDQGKKYEEAWKIEKMMKRIRTEKLAPVLSIAFSVSVLTVSGCAANSACLMSAKEADSFEELSLPPHKRVPVKYRVRGAYRSGFEKSELDLGTSDAPIVYCLLFESVCSKYIDTKLGSGFESREINLTAIVSYGETRGDCPFGALTVERIINISY
jgi:hypothetical protein